MDHRCGIALGSNLGDRLAHLKAARAALVNMSCTEAPIKQSAVYETLPVDCPPGSPAFLNAVLELTIAVSPIQFLLETQAIETGLGRVRSDVHNEARILDIDLLYAGNEIIGSETLSLPHPRLAERLFVLQPLRDICPDMTLPGQCTSIATLCNNLAASDEQVCLFADQW